MAGRQLYRPEGFLPGCHPLKGWYKGIEDIVVLVVLVGDRKGEGMARSDFQAAQQEVEFDPSEIYTRSQDDWGHTFAPRATMPKTMGAQIGAYVASPYWPEYTSAAAFIRDACYHRLKYWASNATERDVLPEATRRIMIEAQMSRAEQYRDELAGVDTLIDTIDSTVGAAIGAGDTRMGNRLLDEFEDLATSAFEEPHRARILEKVDRMRRRLR